MKKINHFVLRNGKMIPKELSEQQKVPQIKKINIIKHTASVKLNDSEIDDKLAILKAAHSEEIKQLKQKIFQLEQQLKDRNQMIRKFDNKSHQLKSSFIQNSKDEPETDESFSIAMMQIPLDSLSNLSTKIRNKGAGFLTDRSSSMVQNLENQEIKNLNELKIKTHRSNFDTSSLMKRLANSQNLVKNMKKVLKGPEQIEKKDKIGQKQTFNQQNFQLNKFLEELMDKHQQILALLDKFNQEKEEEISEICDYYQKTIKEILQGKNITNQVNSLKNSSIYSSPNEQKQNSKHLKRQKRKILKNLFYSQCRF